ncbi:TolC family protein [Marinoscillum pacificum]|uniref:TolC family protein n=1 Tax=Marinoscillum pacificum TaxID=392723 RepID=UPI0021570F14|nr:TolC family protein [Marinoscillum pacificum]
MRKLSLTLLLGFLIGFSAVSQQSTRILDLQQCVDIAIENNLSVRRSELQEQRAKVSHLQSRAEMLPNLNVGGNYGSQWGRSIDPTTNQFITQQINFTGLNGSSNVTLFNWFRIVNTVKQNKYNWESTKYDVDKAKNDISLNIVTFYLNVIFNRELVGNAEYQLNSSQEQLERTKKLVAGGALPRTNELELISQVATNEVNLVNAENNLNLALLNLKQAMLIPVSESIELIIPEIDLSDESALDQTAETVYNDALIAMPEIQSAQLQVDQAIMGVKVAQAGYSPTLSLSGSFRTNYSDAYKLPDDNGNLATVPLSDQFDQNLSRSLSLGLNIPIFNNLRANSNVQNAKINLEQAEIAVMEQQNVLRQTIEQAYNDAYAASKTFSASERQVEALEETFRSIENQYNLGAANFTDYQVAQNNLYRAKSDLVRAKFDFIFKTKVLDFYQGKNLTF